jgi:hypothetical protein
LKNSIKDIFSNNQDTKNEAVSKDRHPALDAGSPKKTMLIISGLQVKSAMMKRIF